MGVAINHAIAFVTSPLAVALAAVALGLALAWFGRRRTGVAVAAAGALWLWFMSSGLAGRCLGLALEREFPPVRAEEMPQADAIVVLGGGVGANTNTTVYAELFAGADRVVHAARLWKAGKAPVVLASGLGERLATRPLLLELGVPESAVLVEEKAGNTEQNARFVAAFLRERGVARPKVLLVTSAWHMRRSLLMFRKYAPGVEVLPAACDHEATLYSDDTRLWQMLLPGAGALCGNSAALKECIGYWGYRLLRR